MTRPRRGFTLIELLVVVAVIAALAGMIFPLIGMVRFRARSLDTTHRIEQVLNGLSSYEQEDGSAALALQDACALGGVARFASLETISSVLAAGGAGRAMPRLVERPDGSGGMWAVYDDNPPTGKAYYHPGTDQDFQQRPHWKDIFEVMPPASGAVDATFYEDAWRYSWPPSDWDQAVPGTRPPILRFPWGKPGLALNGAPCDPAQPATAVLAKVIEWKNNAASTGVWQNNDLTSPANHDDVPVINSWVTLGGATGGGMSYTTASGSQTDAVTSAVNATRSDGSAVSVAANQALPFDLGCLSPLRTIALLQAAGVLDPVSGGADYRSDRGLHRVWNDAWGNPLVVSFALFQPERFLRKCDGQNRRDLLLKKAQEAYGYNRAIYLAVGAIGPTRGDLQASLAELAGSDGEPGDRAALAAVWKRIGATCDAATWTEAGFAAPPWKGVKNGKKSGMRCFLSAPLELR